MIEEEWRQIAGFPDYQVSNHGRVKGLRGALKPQSARGYLFVQLFPGRVSKYVAHLVLETFVGPRPPGLEAEHEDRNRANNAVGNLSWATHSENNLNRGDRKNTLSGIKGVSYYRDRDKWVAQTSVNGKHKTIGYFSNKDDAAKAYADFTGRTTVKSPMDLF